MLANLQLTNFTVFTEAELTFCPGVNVIIGENGTGKTHLLKAGYLAVNAWSALNNNGQVAGKEKTASYFAEQLNQLFRPDRIGSLNNHLHLGKAHLKADIKAVGVKPKSFIPEDKSLCWELSFSAKAESKIAIEQYPVKISTSTTVSRAVYLPSKEMISFFEGFIALTDRHELPFDGTYRDLALNLSGPKLKNKPELLKHQLKKLNDVIGGTLQLDGGRFYLLTTGGGKREVSLLAEGIRKIATLFHLINNGSLDKGATLFWDEPDSNMNPKLVKVIAEVLYNLAADGVQIIIATHSLFLLRELEILSQHQNFAAIPGRVFALAASDNGKGGITVRQGDSASDVDPLVLLDEDLAQADRYMEAS